MRQRIHSSPCNFHNSLTAFQGVCTDTADKGILTLIHLALSSRDHWNESLDEADGNTGCSFASKHSAQISVALAAVCSCSENLLLTSAMADLLRLPVITQCLSFASSPVTPSSNPFHPPLHHVTIADIMSHPITRSLVWRWCNVALHNFRLAD